MGAVRRACKTAIAQTHTIAFFSLIQTSDIPKETEIDMENIKQEKKIQWHSSSQRTSEKLTTQNSDSKNRHRMH